MSNLTTLSKQIATLSILEIKDKNQPFADFLIELSEYEPEELLEELAYSIKDIDIQPDLFDTVGQVQEAIFNKQSFFEEILDSIQSNFNNDFNQALVSPVVIQLYIENEKNLMPWVVKAMVDMDKTTLTTAFEEITKETETDNPEFSLEQKHGYGFEHVDDFNQEMYKIVNEIKLFSSEISLTLFDNIA
jgi:hypothetical protein